MLAPFRSREYRLLIAAVSLSIFAEGMWAVVMALQVIELYNDPASLSLVATCLGVGLVAFLLVGGIAADRINQRAIIIAVESRERDRRIGDRRVGTVGALQIWHMAVAAAALGIAAAFFFPAYSAILPQDPACRTTVGRQRRRRRGAPGVPARRRPCRRRHGGRCDVPAARRGRGGGVVRHRPGAAGGHPTGRESACPRTGSRAAAYAARPAGRLRLHAAHAVAAVDAAVREHVRACGAGTDRGPAAVHRQGTVRRRRADVRLHPGVLRDGQRAGRAGGVVATAAAPLPDGDDGDVERRLHPAWSSSASRRRSR